ncbi:MAG: hypothetical protein HYY18_06340 [Planctomycetes bacterium]|nr:hypothetical protein [Planctomycetota bacterium]
MPRLLFIILAFSLCGCGKEPPKGFEEIPVTGSKADGQVRSLAVSPDQQSILYTSGDAIVVGSLHGTASRRLAGVEPPDQFVMLPGGERLLAVELPHGDLNMSLVVWDWKAGTRIADRNVSEGVNRISASSDGTLAAAACQDGRLRTFSLPGLEPVATFGESARPFAIAFLPGAASLAVADAGRVSIHDGRSGARLGEVPGAACGMLAVSPDGTRLATAPDGGGPIVVFEIAGWKELKRLPGADARSMAFSPDGLWLAVGSHYPAYVDILDVASGSTVSSLRPGGNFIAGVTSVVAIAWIDGGQALAVGDLDRSVWIYERKK